MTIGADSAKRTVTLISPRDPKARAAFTYSTPNAEHVVLVGIDNLRRPGDSVAISLRRIDLRARPLVRPQPWFR